MRLRAHRNAAGKELLALGVGWPAIPLLQDADLGFGETVYRVSALALERCRIELAFTRIGDDAVLQAVLIVACDIHRILHQLHLR